MHYIKSEVYPKTLVMTEDSKYTHLILNELKLEAPEVISLQQEKRPGTTVYCKKQRYERD
jgi:hypothetical protein